LSPKNNPILVFQIFLSQFRKDQKLFFIIYLLIGISPVFSQRVGFGPKVGANMSIFRGDFPVDGMWGPKFGLTGGGYLNFKFKTAKQFQLQIELLYTMRGNNADFLDSFTNPDKDPFAIKNSYAMSYIEVPILFKYMLNKSGMTRPYLFGGPVYSGLMSADFTDEIRGAEENVKDAIKRDDFGLMLGWGISTFIIDRWYHLDVRYYHGFLNSSEFLTNNLNVYRPGFDGQKISEYRNSTISIMLGVGIERRETFFLR
jgi:hypothetical protein